MKALLLIFAMILVPSSALAAVFIKIGDIKGESQYRGYEGDIEVLAWSLSATSDGRSACVDDIRIIKYIDKSSPLLAAGVINGTVYPEATLVAIREGGRDIAFEPYLTMVISNASLSSFNLSGSSDEARPTESISLDFEKIEYTYTQPSDDGRSSGETVSATIYPTRCPR